MPTAAHETIPLLHPASENAVNAKCGSATVQGPRNSPVVAPLRVATACYTTAQRTLHILRFWTPKGSRHTALGCLWLRSPGSLLLRTSQNETLAELRLHGMQDDVVQLRSLRLGHPLVCAPLESPAHPSILLGASRPPNCLVPPFCEVDYRRSSDVRERRSPLFRRIGTKCRDVFRP